MNYEKTQVIPIVESDIFKLNDESQFAIAQVTPKELSDMREFDGAARLRANTYLSEGFVKPEELDENGTELDDDDIRSNHYLMFERTAVQSLVRVVGNLRLVTKTDEYSESLPVERYFPESFPELTPIGSVEVSRLIARHEDARVQSMLKWPMFIAGYKHVIGSDGGPVYGLMTRVLARQLSLQGVPLTSMAEPRYIEEINATKHPVEVDVPRLGRMVDATGDYGIDVLNNDVSYVDFNYSGKGTL